MTLYRTGRCTFAIALLAGLLAYTNALACSPPPPIEPVLMKGPDGKLHKQYPQDVYAFHGEVIGPVTSSVLRTQDQLPVQGIRVRVSESMTKMVMANSEVEIFVRGMAGAGCEIGYGVSLQLPVGTRILFESRSLVMGEWERGNLTVRN